MGGFSGKPISEICLVSKGNRNFVISGWYESSFGDIMNRFTGFFLEWQSKSMLEKYCLPDRQ